MGTHNDTETPPVDGAAADDPAASGDGAARTAAGDADDAAVARRPGTTHPRLARERALKVLFQADVRGEDPRVVLDRIETTRGALVLLDELEPDQDQVDAEPDLQLELTRRARLPLDDYTRQLVGGVASRRSAIDRLLGEISDNWAVARMPVVDRNLLRLAIHELVVEDTPHPVVIDEAVALACAFAGDKAVSFVNGVLEAVRQAVARGDVELGASVDLPDPDAAAAGADAGAGAGDAAGAGADAGAAGSTTAAADVGEGAVGESGAEAEPDAQPDAKPDAHGAAAWNDALDLLGLAPEPAPGSAPEPSPEPAPGPAAEPSAEPAAGPTPGPAAAPSAAPSAEPAAGPTPGPAAEPSAEPAAGAASGDVPAPASRHLPDDDQHDPLASTDGGEPLDDEDDLDPETEVAILLGERGPDGEPLEDDSEAAATDTFDAAFDDEADDRFDGIDDFAGAEQDALFGDDPDDQD